MSGKNNNKTVENLKFIRELQRFVDEEYDVLQIKYHYILDQIHQPNNGLNARAITQLSLAAQRIKSASLELKDLDGNRGADVNLKIAEESLMEK